MAEHVWLTLVVTDNATSYFVSRDPDISKNLALADLSEALGYKFADWDEAQDKSCDGTFCDKYGEFILNLSYEKIYTEAVL